MWPILSDICIKYQPDVRVTERCCRSIRFALRCLGKESVAILTPLVTQIVSLFERFHHSCFLYLGSIIVDEYATEAEFISGLLDMLQVRLLQIFERRPASCLEKFVTILC